MRKTAIKQKNKRRARRKAHIRKQVRGKASRPRMSVYRSSQHIYVQIIDDDRGMTLCGASTVEKVHSEKTANVAGAIAVGRRLAERAKEVGVSKIVFDRNGYKFHGRVKALADAAREAGLEF